MMARFRRLDVELLVVALLTFALNATVAYLLIVQLSVFAGDAVARTYSAKSLLLGSEPKLANVGFVWAPLPTVLQVPLLLFPPLRYRNLAGGVLTAIMGAGVAVLLTRFLRHVLLPPPIRWLMVAAFVVNPMILLYSANGMSEMTLIFCTVLTIYFYWRWQATGLWLYLASSGMAAAAACLARYDGLFVAGALMVTVAVETFVQHPAQRAYTESAVLLFGTPVAYGFSLWVLSNWLIMGDPLFFAHSPLSLAGRITGLLLGREWILTLKGNLLGTVKATLLESWNLSPVFPVATVALGWLAINRRAWRGIVLLIAAWALTLFTAVNIYAGGSQYSLRYFIAAIPMGYVLAAGLLQLLGRWRMPAAILLFIGFVASGFTAERAMRRPDPFDHDDYFVPTMLSQQPAAIFKSEQELAQYIDSQTQGLVLVDDFQGNQVVIFSAHPDRFITSSHSQFQAYLADPVGHVAYFMVNKPGLYLDLINRAYPDLYDQGGPWVRLEKESGLWKLYRISGPPSQLLPQGAPNQISPP